MNKYDKLMREIVSYLDGSWLHSRHLSRGKGPIRGSSAFEIEQAERESGKQLPLSLKAWYRVAGAFPPYLNDYDADYSLADFKRAQETAVDLVEEKDCEWELTDTIIPFTQRIGDQFMFVNTDEGIPEDPPVYHYMSGPLPRRVKVAFTVFIRETWLDWLDFPAMSDEYLNEMRSWREKDYDNWESRKQVINALRAEAYAFRRQLIETVHQEDVTKDAITGPQAFQQRWLQEFASTEIRQKLISEGLRIPYDWVDPPSG